MSEYDDLLKSIEAKKKAISDRNKARYESLRKKGVPSRVVRIIIGGGWSDNRIRRVVQVDGKPIIWP